MKLCGGIEQLDFHLDEELQQLARIADGAEFAEGLAAFFEKRRGAVSLQAIAIPPTVRRSSLGSLRYRNSFRGKLPCRL